MPCRCDLHVAAKENYSVNLWNCPASEEWDRYLVDPESAEDKQLGAHLESCPFCRLVVNEKRRELTELAGAWQQGELPRVIHVKPTSDLSNLPLASTPLLAAKGQTRERAVGAVSLASADQKVLLRAVRDSRTGDLWLYLISDDPRLRQDVIIEPFGMKQEYAVDERGRVNLGRMDWPAADQLYAKILVPTATFKMTPLNFSEDGEKSAILETEAGDRIEIAIDGTSGNLAISVRILELATLRSESPTKLAIRWRGKAGSLQVQPVTSNLVQFTAVEIDGGLDIFVF